MMEIVMSNISFIHIFLNFTIFMLLFILFLVIIIMLVFHNADEKEMFNINKKFFIIFLLILVSLFTIKIFIPSEKYFLDKSRMEMIK